MQKRAKICGLTRHSDVQAAEDAGASFLGFIVGAESSRKISLQEARTLIQSTSAQTVAVTVNPGDQLVSDIQKAGFSHIQLHGDESLQRVAMIAKSGLSVIKAVPVSTADDVKLATEYSGAADYVLFDAKPPKGETQRGGHGLAFDWSILRAAPLPKRYILAGGLNPDNIAQAVTAARAPIVDVSSGVETAPGLKDPSLIHAFMEQLRGSTRL